MTAVEQLGGEQDGNDEGQLRAAVNGLAVGVAPELAVVGEPGVRPFDRPPATEPARACGIRVSFGLVVGPWGQRCR